MPQSEWKDHDKCFEKCVNGPEDCEEKECTKDHWLKPGEMSPHMAI